MTSVIYASLSALLIVWLSLNTIQKRRSHKVSLGDGGVDDLKHAIAAQSNAIEYIPIALILLFALEYNHGNMLLIHLLGISLIIGRVLHAKSLLSSNLKQRILGMQITIYTIIGLAVVNFAYLPYTQFKR
jgi:uncharacterized membrane protein YecN with MAPEG domain